MQAMMRSAPPQAVQVSISMSKTRLRRCAQVIAARRLALDETGLRSVTRVGDCLAPATIAAAVYDGHRYARELDGEVDPDAVPFKRGRFDLGAV